MKFLIVKLVLLLVFLSSTLVGLLSIAGHQITPCMMKMNENELTSHDMKHGPCIVGEFRDQKTTDWDCLKHCFQTVAQSSETTVLTTAYVLLVIVASVFIVIFIRFRSTPPFHIEWFRPFYVFNTVQLLE